MKYGMIEWLHSEYNQSTLNISLKFIYFFVNDALMYDRKFFNHKMHLVKDVLFYLNVSATPPFFIVKDFFFIF